MIEKRCVICDNTYLTEIDRGDNKTCSVACRSKLHRERRKAKEERTARLLDKNERHVMIWLQKNIPEGAHNLSKIKAIHGNEAFQLALDTAKKIGLFYQERKT